MTPAPSSPALVRRLQALDFISPDGGGTVMGTGIVSSGMALVGQATLSNILLGAAVALWIGLAAIFAGRAALGRRRWADDVRDPTALTAVAATAVLGDRLAAVGADPAGDALLVVATCLWLGLLVTVLAHWATPTVGASFLLTVATEALAVLAADLAVDQRLVPLAIASFLPLALGLAAYVFVLARLDLRQLVIGRGDHWVTGGALAIATLACVRTGVAVRTVDALPALGHALDRAALALWVAAALWLAALVAGELTAPRPRYDTRRWSTVFPLGMYAVCSLAAGRATGIGSLITFGRIWIWFALGVWLATLLGMLRRALALRPAGDGCRGGVRPWDR
jgi:tellurite resistance protein TehA-like permease